MISGFDLLNSLSITEDSEIAQENADAPELTPSDDEAEDMCGACDQDNDSEDEDKIIIPRKARCCGGERGHDHNETPPDKPSRPLSTPARSRSLQITTPSP